jgi:hypothetical protein
MKTIDMEQLRGIVNSVGPAPPRLDDDALAYSGAALWSDWENHVPAALVAMWDLLSEEARMAVYLTAFAVTAYEADATDFANPLCNINDTCRIRGFTAGPSGESTEDRVIALAQAYDALKERCELLEAGASIEGKRPWEFCCEWYRPEEIHRCIAQRFGEDRRAVPEDVHSLEFAEFLCEQYRLAMNKGIQIGRGWGP